MDFHVEKESEKRREEVEKKIEAKHEKGYFVYHLLLVTATPNEVQFIA